MAKQPFVRTTNFTDISKKLKPLAQNIGMNQALSPTLAMVQAKSSNQQILDANPARPSMLTTTDSPTKIGSGFLAEDKRELNSDETEFALENFARLPENIQKQLIQSGQAPQQYMSKDDVKSFLTTYNSTPDPDYGQSIPADRDLMNQTFGVSGTDITKETAGALPKEAPTKTVTTSQVNPLDYAKQIAEGAFAGQTGSEPDWGVASLLYFSKLAENASKPGATFLGAAGSAGTAPAAYLMQKEKEKADLETKKASLVASLIPSIITAQKGKTGKMNVIQSGPAMDENGQQKTNAKGDLLFTFIRQDASGNTLETFEAPKASGTTINMPEQKEISDWLKNTTNTNTGLYKEDVMGSRKSKAAAGQYDEILNYLDNPEFETNWKAGKLQGIKEMLGGLGILDEKALDQVQNAQAFRAKTYSLVLASVAQMKGALSDRELVFLQQQTVSLSNSKVANQLIALSTKKILDQASRFDDFQFNWQKSNLKGDDGKWRTIQNNAEYLQMMADWRQLPENKENIYQYVTRLSTDYRNELLNQYKGEVNEDNEIIPGTLIDPVNPNVKIPAGSTREKEIVGQINNQVNQRFATKAHEKIFGNKFKLDEKSVFDTRSE